MKMTVQLDGRDLEVTYTEDEMSSVYIDRPGQRMEDTGPATFEGTEEEMELIRMGERQSAEYAAELKELAAKEGRIMEVDDEVQVVGERKGMPQIDPIKLLRPGEVAHQPRPEPEEEVKREPGGAYAIGNTIYGLRQSLFKKYKFCPRCSNMLLVKPLTPKERADFRWKCSTCPYNLPIKHKRKFLIYRDPRPDGSDDESEIVETTKADEHRQRTEILCPKCDKKEAFFYQMQTRSADEPMTTFYECCERACRHTWRD